MPRSVRGVARIEAWRDPATEALANHQPRLDPAVEVLDARDADDRREVAVDQPRDVAELVGAIPDVGARAFDRPRTAGKHRRPRGTDRADVSAGPPGGNCGNREAAADRDPVTAAARGDHAQLGDVAGRARVLPDALPGLGGQVGASGHRLKGPSIVHRIRQRHRREDVRRIGDFVGHGVRHATNHRIA